MAVQRRINVRHGDVFPHGAYIRDAFEPVSDFNTPARPNGLRPQPVDKANGLPVWQISVIHAEPEAGRKEKAGSVKVDAKVQPLPPENKSATPLLCTEAPGLPWTEHHRVPVVSSDLMRFLCSQCPVNLDCTIFTRSAEVSAGFWAGSTRNPVYEPGGAA